jgi:manganese efflux pump family protein
MSAAPFKIAIIASALALDVFAVSVGVGIRGVTRAQKIRIGIAFACAEILMNLVGAGIGALTGRVIGEVAGYVGFGVLFALGVYMMRESRTKLSAAAQLDLSHGPGLLMASLAISLDSLGIGFSILYVGVPLGIALFAIGAASVASTTLGLTIGSRLGRYAERNAGFTGGLILALTGIVFATLKALHAG